MYRNLSIVVLVVFSIYAGNGVSQVVLTSDEVSHQGVDKSRFEANCDNIY